VPAATFAGRSPFGRVLAFGIIGLGIVSALLKLSNLKPARRRRVRRLSQPAGDDRGVHCARARAFARAERGARPRQPLARAAGRKLPPPFPLLRFAPKDSARVVFTGNPVRPEAAAAAKRCLTRRRS